MWLFVAVPQFVHLKISDCRHFTSNFSYLMFWLHFRRYQWKRRWMDTWFQKFLLRVRATLHNPKRLDVLCKSLKSFYTTQFWIRIHFWSCCQHLINFIYDPPYIIVFQMPPGHLEGPRTLWESARAFHFLGIMTEQSGNQGDVFALKCLSCPAFCWNIKSRCEHVESDALEAAAEETKRVAAHLNLFTHQKHIWRVYVYSGGKKMDLKRSGFLKMTKINVTFRSSSPFLQNSATLQTQRVSEALQHLWSSPFVVMLFFLFVSFFNFVQIFFI